MSLKFLTTTSLALVLLGACSATTNGSGMASNSVATAPSVALQASQPGDGAKTCAQLTADIASVDAVYADAAAVAGTERMDNITNGAMNAAARHAIARSGAARSVVSKVPFGGALLSGALNAKANADKKKRDDAVNTAQNAMVRRSSLMGIYTGKGCS